MSRRDTLPYATDDIEAIFGTIKQKYEDFFVEEIPAYEPCGTGDHLYFKVTKKGLSTRRAIKDISRALGVRPQDIGYAGLKDARAVSCQMMSVEHLDADALTPVSIPRISLLPLGRHGNKLRMGHLRGNRFCIRIRETDMTRLGDAERILDRLSSYGVPNYFGEQRFGNRGDTGKVGLSLLVGDYSGAAALIAGAPTDRDAGKVLHARELFTEKKYGEAAGAWPPGFFECVSVCRNMERYAGDAKKAVMKLDKKTLGFYVSAGQSGLFNQILTERIEELDRVEVGDVAWKHDSGAVFLVEDETAELPRAANFEISATGPLFGPKMKQPEGAQQQREERVLLDNDMTLENFAQKGPLRCPGGRRALRFPLAEMSASAGGDGEGDYLELKFVLPPGCYATGVIREICKDKLQNADDRVELRPKHQTKP